MSLGIEKNEVNKNLELNNNLIIDDKENVVPLTNKIYIFY